MYSYNLIQKNANKMLFFNHQVEIIFAKHNYQGNLNEIL